MDYSLKSLGLSDNILKTLYKAEIYNVISLINYLPSKYEIYTLSDSLNLNCTIKIKINSKINVSNLKKVHKISFFGLFKEKEIEVIIFNREYLKNKLIENLEIIISGKYDNIYNKFIVNQIFFEEFSEKIIPIYKNIELLNYKIKEIMQKAYSYLKDNFKEEIPKKYLYDYKLLTINEFYDKAHFPKTSFDVKQVYRRLKYQELLNLEIKYQYIKYLNKKQIKDPKNYDLARVKNFISKLPFELTTDQKNTLNQIFKDLKSKYVMNRLVEGDVGSGKTILCVISSLGVVSSNYQVAFMAPTEMLAMQHYNTFKNLLKDENINVELIISSKKKSEKDQIYNDLKSGKIHILIGTHAILNTQIEFLNLGLIITDEQQRFGVNQRKLLKEKGTKVDALFLSATPIPRTMALTFFGDLDLSIIKDKPSGRKEIITKLINKQEIAISYEYIYNEVKKGNAVYIVAPKILEGTNINVSNVLKIYETLKKEFKDVCDISLLHGKMTKEEKERNLNDFYSLKKPILVSTTMVEVGIDLKDATLIIIYDAYMFGLSQLHQLRGRVGRSNKQSYCLLISDLECDRLNEMVKSNDGFYLAECDLKERGMGDILGLKQSGNLELKYSSLKDDIKILEIAKKDAIFIIESNLLFNNKEYYYLLKNLKEELKAINLTNLD